MTERAERTDLAEDREVRLRGEVDSQEEGTEDSGEDEDSHLPRCAESKKFAVSQLGLFLPLLSAVFEGSSTS